MRMLSPESRRRRFLSVKSSLSQKEVEFLTRCDMVDHLAIGLAITDEHGQEKLPVAVARCVRAADDPTLGDVAVVVLDEWQRRGIGSLLTERLARLSREVGIKRWRGVFFADNLASRKLMERVGRSRKTKVEGAGVVEVVFELVPPRPGLR
jgi:GNAT superfamily N-acetyltransferase